MKRYLLIILLSLHFINAKAQAWIYHPMPDSNAVWRVDWYTGSACPPMSLFASYQYTIEGDTTIGIYTYKKIYASGINNICNGPLYLNLYEGAMRQDILNKKVYFKCPGNYNDTILYDFNLNIGDTIKHLLQCYPSSGLPAIVASIDSVLVGATFHKCFNCTDGTRIIEGVGSTAGLIEEHLPFENEFDLICFSHDTDIYPSTTSSCPLVQNTIGIREINHLNDELRIVPNPINTEGIIEFTNGNDIIKDIEIYSTIGVKVIWDTNVNKSKYTLYRDKLKSGLYILKVTTKKNNLFVLKFITN